ncbi:tetratricopeptide repeat protein [Myxococcota bacterium]|nr:tetratricopeptide repeat protein [Myxococcota bacterium]
MANNPDDAEALAQLEAALARAEDWDGLVSLTAERVKALSDEDRELAWETLTERLGEHVEDLEPPQRSQLAFVIGQIWEARLGQTEEAMKNYQFAFQVDPSNLKALRAARAIYVAVGQWRFVLRLCSLELNQVKEEAAQAEIYFTMADVCLNHLDSPEDAVRCVQQAKAIVADDDPRLAPFSALLQEAYQAHEARYQELLDGVEKARDPRQKANLLVEAANVWAEVNVADERIRADLKQALELNPRSENARVLLEHVLEVSGQWDELVENLKGRLENTARKSDRLAIFQRLAQIIEQQAEDPSEAIEYHREVLELSPGEPASLDFCVDYYGEHKDWQNLVAVYEAALRTRHRGGDEAAMLIQIAMTLWKKVGDLENAEGYFKRIKLNEPRNALMLQFYTEYYTQGEDYKRLLGVLSTRQSLEEDEARQIELGLEMARVSEENLGNLAKAIDIWKSILRLNERHEPAREALRRLFFETKKWNALLEFLKEDLALVEEADIEGQVEIYLKIIEIYREQLNLPVMVINTYNQILQVDPTNADALAALQEKYEAGGRWNDLITILERRAEAAEAAGDVEGQVELLREIAGLWLDKFSNPNSAITYLEALLGLRADDEAAINQLIDIYQQRRDWAALYRIYTRQLDLLEGEALTARLVELAEIADERLDAQGDAIALWQRVVEVAPGNERAWAALEGLYQKTEQWSDLAGLYESRSLPPQAIAPEGEEAEEAEPLDPALRVTWLKKLAQTRAERLGDEALAAESWREVLRLSPGDVHAERYLRDLYLRQGDWVAMEGLYGERGDWTGLVHLMGAQAVEQEEVHARVDLYRRMARVCLDKLDNEVAAMECWERIIEEDPDNQEAAAALAPRYAEAGAWDELVATIEIKLRAQPQDPIPLMLELAEIHEARRQDLAQAFFCYASALQADPARADLLVETERTAALCENLDGLATLLDDLIDGAEDEADAATARLRRVLAGVYRDHLDQPEEAALQYEAIRELEGDRIEVLEALERIYKHLERWPALLEVYERSLEALDGEASLDDAARLAHRRRLLAALGQLHEETLKDPKAARAAYEALRALAPKDLDALKGLQRLAEAEDNVAQLTEYVTAELELVTTPADKAQLRYRLGILAARAGDEEAAVNHFGLALNQARDHEGVIASLQARLDGPYAKNAARLLEPAVRATEDWAELRRVLAIRADDTPDPLIRHKRLEEIAQIQEERLGAPAEAFETHALLLREDPKKESTRAHLERLAALLGNGEALAALYAEFALGGARADSADPILYSQKLAELLEAQELQEQARETLSAVLLEEGDTLPLLDKLEQLSRALEDWAALVDICERRLPLLEADPEATRAELFAMAELLEVHLSDPEAAIEVYQRVYAEHPDDARALAALERIFREIGGWERLAALLEARLEGAEPELAAALGAQLAAILYEHLQRAEEALDRYAAVLEIAPEHEETEDALQAILAETDEQEAPGLRARVCDILEPLYLAREDWLSLIHVLQERLADSQDPEERVALNLRMAGIYEREEEQDLAAAMSCFGAAFDERYGDEAIRAELLRLAEALDAWQGLTEIFRRGLDNVDVDPQARQEMLAQTAGIFEDRLDDLAQAVALNRLILDEEPEDLDALARLDRLYTKLEDLPALVDILEQRVMLLESPEDQIALNFRLGALYRDKLGDLEQAVEAFARVRRDIDPQNQEAFVALEDLYATTGAYEPLVEALLEHAELLEGEDRKRLLFRAAATMEDGLERPKGAVEVYQRVLELDEADATALEALDRLFNALSQPIELLEILEREHALAKDDAARDALDHRMGVILWQDLEDPVRAVAHFRAVLGRDAAHQDARDALEALFDTPEVRLEIAEILIPIYEAEGAWAALRDTLKGTLSDLDEPARRVETLRKIAGIEEGSLGAPAEAFATLSEALREAPLDLEIEAELERIAQTLGLYSELLSLLDEVVLDAPERAVDLHLKMAKLAEEQLEDAARAIEEHREVLELEPDNATALGALERLYHDTGVHGDLVEILERKAEALEDLAERKPLLARIALIQEDILDDKEQAVETWRRLLAEDERDANALGALERLLSGQERWVELSALFEHRVSVCAPEARAEVEFGFAQLLEAHLKEGSRAVDLYQGILERDAAHEAAIQALAALFNDEARAEEAGVDRNRVAMILEPLYREREDFAALVAVLTVRQEAQQEDPILRVALLKEIAALREARLDDIDGARETCALILTINPEDEENRQQLYRLTESTQAFDALCEQLREVIEDIHIPDVKVALLLELGRLEETHRREMGEAQLVYHDVLEIEPENEAAIKALVELFSHDSAWEELVQLYLGQASHRVDPEGQKELYFKVAHLFEDVLEDNARAVATYRQILDIEPDNPEAFKALKNFFTNAASWAELADVLRDELQYTDAPEARAALRYQLGEILEMYLEDLDGAITAWREVVEDDAPGHAAAMEALERLLSTLRGDALQADKLRQVADILEPIYRQRLSWAPWVNAVEVQLLSIEDRWQRLEHLVEIARIQEAELGDAQGAFEAYARAFAEDYGNPDLQGALDRLGDKLQAWQPLVDVYLAGIDDFSDLDSAVEILVKVAGIFDVELGDAAQAINTYRRLLLIEPEHLPALNALERILDMEAQYDELVEVLAQKAELTDDLAEKKELLNRICEIWEGILDNPAEAIGAYRAIFEEDPQDREALAALIRLYRRTEDWPRLVEALREELDLTEGDAEKKALLFEMAEIHEQQIKDFDATIQTYRGVLEMDERDRQAIEALDRLLTQEGRFNELIGLLEGDIDGALNEGAEEAQIDAIRLRIGGVLEHQLEEVERAIAIYGEILMRDPERAEAKAALERLLDEPGHRLQAARLLADHYDRQDSPADLARVLEQQLLDLDEPHARVGMLKRLAALHRDRLSDARQAYETYARAFTEDCSDEDIIAPLHALTELLSIYDELAEVYQARIAQTVEPELLRPLNRGLARLYDERLEDAPRAIAAWQRVLDEDAFDDEALAALQRLHQAAEDWSAVISVARRRLDLVDDPEENINLRFLLAYLLEVVEGALGEAVELHRQILWDKPEHAHSREAMERLAASTAHRAAIAEVLDPIYRDMGDWARLATLTEMRIDLLDDPQEIARLWAEVAEIRERKLNDEATAFQALLRAFVAHPTDEEIRDNLLRLAEREEGWATLIDIFTQAQEDIEDPDLRVEDQLRLAGWCRAHLADEARAVHHYREALKVNPNTPEALDALERLYSEGEAWAELAQIYRYKIQSLFDLEAKRARLHQLGELCAVRLKDHSGAVTAYEEALRIDDSDATALSALERLHRQAEDWSALCRVMERRVEGLDDEAKREAIYRQLGELYDARLSDEGKAAVAWERVLDTAAGDEAALTALKRLYTQLSDWAKLQRVLTRWLAAVEDEARRVELLFELGRNAVTCLDDVDGAINDYRQILTLRPDNKEALSQLETLYAQRGRWAELVKALREHLAALEGKEPVADRVARLVRLASIASTHLKDAEAAIKALKEVLEHDPDHLDALTLLAELYRAGGDWAGSAAILEKILKERPSAESWRQLGDLYIERLEDRQQGKRALNEAAQLGDGEAVNQLITIAREEADKPSLARLLPKQLERLEGKERLTMLVELADIFKDLDQRDAQIDMLKEAVLLAPDQLKISDALLEAYFAASRHAEAEPLLKRIISNLESTRRRRDLLKYNFHLGCVAEERGDEVAALAAFSACFDYDATYVPNLLHLARLHFKREDWDQALKIFQAILLQQMNLEKPERVDVFYHLGCVYQAKDNARRARDMFKRALSLDAEHAPSQAALDALE